MGYMCVCDGVCVCVIGYGCVGVACMKFINEFLLIHEERNLIVLQYDTVITLLLLHLTCCVRICTGVPWRLSRKAVCGGNSPQCV